MGKLSEQEDQWQREATASAVAAARATAQGQDRLAVTPAGRLSDEQWGWVISAAIFDWIKTRYRQAIAEGLAQEAHVTRMTPSPRDSAIVRSILPTLADQATIDWSKPLASWSRNEMAGFIDLAWTLLDEAQAALELMPDTILHKPDERVAEARAREDAQHWAEDDALHANDVPF
jgi:hypothetical protein